MAFQHFIGNQKVKRRLESMLDSSQLPHAIIIEGDAGTGKRTLACELAAAIVCRGQDRPCHQCSQCRKAMGKIHPDIHEYSARPGTVFKVDTVRHIVNDAYMPPNEAEHKIYILENCQQMNQNAQNALLKILEEPPSYIIFLMTAEVKEMLLPTVLSRSVVLSVRGVDPAEGAEYICARNKEIDSASARRALEIWNGNVGKAEESLLAGKTDELVQLCVDLCRAIVEDNEYSLIRQCSAFQKDRQGIVDALILLKSIFRDALLFSDRIAATSGQTETAKMLSVKLTDKKLMELIRVTDELRAMTEMNANNSLIITKICYSLRRAVGR